MDKKIDVLLYISAMNPLFRGSSSHLREDSTPRSLPFNFSESNELNQRILLVGAMLVALGAILVVLKLSFSLQRGFAVIQSGLLQLRTEPGYRLPDQSHDLRTIALAINEMAESRQAAEADLRREDRLRMMGRVVAGIAHEIRNPLNSIRLTVRVLARRLQSDSTAAEPLSLITGEIDRLDARKSSNHREPFQQLPLRMAWRLTGKSGPRNGQRWWHI
ncbi:MAG: histidine kinase dimerization/phospho-acceptor domain-containing protein [Bryobacteraceae bacterium]